MGHFLDSLCPYEERLGCFHELETCLGSRKEETRTIRFAVEARSYGVVIFLKAWQPKTFEIQAILFESAITTLN